MLNGKIRRIFQPDVQWPNFELFCHLHNHLKQRFIGGKLFLKDFQNIITISDIVIYLKKNGGSWNLRIMCSKILNSEIFSVEHQLLH